MSEIYYSTNNGKRDGRASYFFRDRNLADERVDQQNGKAASMGLDPCYKVASCDDADVEKKDIR